ncbi:MAG: 1-acyl-sn-glycerol-3-phosphate acyltransferase [Alicyclobacillus sp.]|nr:1-acyl-sn-glycerol-3-phosphate acyltransferase [Alicyclobacillus sp.]
MAVIEYRHDGFYKFARVVVVAFFRSLYRWRVIGADHIPAHGSVVLASNHIHNFDPPLIGACTYRFVYFMAKEELFRIPGVGRFLRSLGAFPVKRGMGDRTAVREAIRIPSEGGCLVIFPEGHRGRDGVLQPGKPGVAFIARKAGAPIVPVAIIGPYRFRQPLTVRFGRPIMADEHDTNDTLLEKLMSSIQDLLDQGHAP